MNITTFSQQNRDKNKLKNNKDKETGKLLRIKKSHILISYKKKCNKSNYKEPTLP